MPTLALKNEGIPPERLERFAEMARNLRTVRPEDALTPGDFSRLLAGRGIDRSVWWVRERCKSREIFTLPAFRCYFIPKSEIDRFIAEGPL